MISLLHPHNRVHHIYSSYVLIICLDRLLKPNRASCRDKNQILCRERYTRQLSRSNGRDGSLNRRRLLGNDEHWEIREHERCRARAVN